LDDRVTDALLWELFVQAGPLGTPIAPEIARSLHLPWP